MNREALDRWCELGILALVLAILLLAIYMFSSGGKQKSPSLPGEDSIAWPEKWKYSGIPSSAVMDSASAGAPRSLIRRRLSMESSPVRKDFFAGRSDFFTDDG